jgi:hypothetical protein
VSRRPKRASRSSNAASAAKPLVSADSLALAAELDIVRPPLATMSMMSTHSAEDGGIGGIS